MSQEQQKSRLYTELWWLTHYEKSDSPYFGMSVRTRQYFSDLFTGMLEIERRNQGLIDPATPLPDKAEALPSTTTQPSVDAPSTDLLPIGFVKNQKQLTIPFARQLTRGASRGKYPKGYPIGALVHFTAGHRNGLEEGNKLMRNTGMLYLLIDKDGNIGQSNPLNEHGYHGGASAWQGISGYVSDDLVGIELQGAGQLTKYKDKYYPWWDRANGGSGSHQWLAQNAINEAEVIYYPKKVGNIQPGYYQRYTQLQIMALTRLLLWLYFNNTSVFNPDFILGHDEVAPSRKNDPGGSLLQDMGSYRAYLDGLIRKLS